MATEIKMPKLGIDMVDGSIARWMVSEGDEVAQGDVIAEIETDKSTVEMEAPAGGTMLKLVIGEEELVDVGTVIAYVGEAGEAVPEGGANGSAPSAEAESETREEAAQVPTKPADEPARAAAAPSGEAPSGDLKISPVARRLAEEEGIDPSGLSGSGPGGRITKDDVEKALVALTDQEPPLPDGVRASPAARRLAKEKGYAIAEIPGTGPDGRIVARDVNDYEPAAAPAEAPAAAPAPAAPSAPVGAQGEAEEVPLSRMRKRISEVLTASKGPVPHFYVTMDVDMAAAMALRKEMNGALAESGVKISFNDLVVKATALALRQFPNINASFAGDKIIKHGDINVGIAVSTESGLMTVATRQSDRLTLSELSSITRERADRARAGKIKPDDIGGTTFTVSNLGMYGVDSFVAIITPPEAGILAVGGIRQEPVVENGEIVIGQRMRATISADHRVTDGAEAAEFMLEFKRLLENPMLLML